MIVDETLGIECFPPPVDRLHVKIVEEIMLQLFFIVFSVLLKLISKNKALKSNSVWKIAEPFV